MGKKISRKEKETGKGILIIILGLILTLVYLIIQTSILSIIPTIFLYVLLDKKIRLYKIFFSLTFLFVVLGFYLEDTKWFKGLFNLCGADSKITRPDYFVGKVFMKMGDLMYEYFFVNRPYGGTWLEWFECPNEGYIFGIGLLITILVGIYSIYYEVA